MSERVGESTNSPVNDERATYLPRSLLLSGAASLAQEDGGSGLERRAELEPPPSLAPAHAVLPQSNRPRRTRARACAGFRACGAGVCMCVCMCVCEPGCL
eukprot:GHVU01113947.1.p1 GENE.GHVU01113947.1~~GHVU01113947.1.p1  ORF type:complete len:100 (-),score=4.22 GHVU01113947.1:21-320(-)